MTVQSPQNRIGVKDAVQAAMAAIRELLPASELNDLRLEEVDQSEDERFWLITLGFYPPSEGPLAPLARAPRKYKVFTVDADTGKVRSMKIRAIP
jgi:hypothetical protein